MSTKTFEEQCAEICPRCAMGDPVRLRTDSNEWVHDWAFGGTDPKTGKLVGRGHGFCLADGLRKQRGQS